MTVIQIGLAVFLAVSPFFLSAGEESVKSDSAAQPFFPQIGSLHKSEFFLPKDSSYSSQVKHKLNPLISSSENKLNLLLSANETQLNKVIEEQIKNHQKGAKSQEKISSMAEETKDIVSEYEVTLRQIESTRSYNEQLKKLIKDQTDEMQSIRTQIVEVKQTSKDIMPLMLEMTKNLERFIDLDIPFLMKERKKRLKEIKEIMNRADVSVSEKYRRLMEAYQIESEYGRTLEAYQGIQDIENKTLSVNYLRMGRIALIYQSLDGTRQAYWNKDKKVWVSLSSRYGRAVEAGLKVARKQQAPSLLTVPVPAPIRKGNTP